MKIDIVRFFLSTTIKKSSIQASKLILKFTQYFLLSTRLYYFCLSTGGNSLLKKDITSNRSKHWLEWNDYKQPKVKNYLLNLRERYGFSEFYFSDLLVIVNNGVKYLLSIDYNGAVLYVYNSVSHRHTRYYKQNAWVDAFNAIASNLC